MAEELVPLFPTIWVSNAATSVASNANRLIQEFLETNQKAKRSTSLVYEKINASLKSNIFVGALNEKHWKHSDSKADLLRVYNPESLMWERIEPFLSVVLTAVVGPFQGGEIEKLATYILNKGMMDGTVKLVPETYTGLRYQLFSNGIYDLKYNKLIEIPEQRIQDEPVYKRNGEISGTVSYLTPQVQVPIYGDEIDEETGEPKQVDSLNIPQLGLTPKHLHNIEFPDVKMKNPKYASNDPEHPWNIDEWFYRIAGCDKEVMKYILMVVGVMLVPNHRFNAFIEINGAPNSGKTTLLNIVDAIYNNPLSTLMGASITSFKDPFPFRGRVTENTDIVHITEVNGAYLNESDVDFLNSFANNEMQMKQMGSESVTLTPPPLIVLEGKGWARFSSVQTGVARRLLPVDITNSDTKGFVSKRYHRQVFMRPKVLQRIALLAMRALHDYTKGDDYFMFQIDNLDSLPIFAQQWHTDAVTAGDENMKTFITRIKPALRSGKIHMTMLYELYKQSLAVEYPDGTERSKVTRGIRSFRETVPVFLKDSFNIQPIKGMVRVPQDELGINLTNKDGGIGEFVEVPSTMSDYERSNYAKLRLPNWYTIEEKNKKEN